MIKNRWFYVILGVILMMFAGIGYSWSVLSRPLAATFSREWSAAQLSGTFTITMIMFCMGCLLAGYLSKKTSPKLLLLVASVLFCSGFLLTAGTKSILQLYLGFGILVGMGVGFVYNISVSTATAWFPDKPGLISGTLLMGYAFSSFLFGKIFAAVTPADGSENWRITFRILAVIFFLVLLSGSLLIKYPPANIAEAYTQGVIPITKKPTALDVPPGKMLKTPSFYTFFLWTTLAAACGYTMVSQSANIAASVGTGQSDSVIATVAGLVSIFNGMGRVIFGRLYDQKGHRVCLVLEVISFLTTGILLAIAVKTGSFALIIPGFIIGGFASSGAAPINTSLARDFFGHSNYALNFSIINLNSILGSTASTVAGALYDTYGSYFSTALMLVIIACINLGVAMLVRRPASKNV